MRGGVPALFVLQALLARKFAEAFDSPDPAEHRRPRAGRRWALGVAAVLLLLGAGNTFLEYRRHWVRAVANRSLRDVPRVSRPVPTLFELQLTLYHKPGFDFINQYLGPTRGVYGTLLAPRLPSGREEVPHAGTAR